LIISKNWSQIKRRAKVILKLNSNKLRELHWIAKKTYTHYPFAQPLDSIFGPMGGPYTTVHPKCFTIISTTTSVQHPRWSCL